MATINVLDAAGVSTPVEKPLTPGQALSAASRPVVIASDQSAIPITSAVLPASLGSKTSAASLPVVIASDQGGVPITSALLPASLGTKIAAASLAVTLASNDALVAATGTTADAVVASGATGSIASYLRTIKDTALSTTPSPVKVAGMTAKLVPASSTNFILGATGAVGDRLSHLVITPTTTSPGAVSFTDGAILAVPVANAPTTAATGGTLAAATYYYKITALGAAGETIGSNEVSQVTTGTTSTVTVTWAAITGATGYRIYRGTAAAGENVYYAVGVVTTFTDTGAASTGGTPPVTNNAYAGPLDTVFVGGAGSVSNLVPFVVPLGNTAVGTGFKITTGANVTVTAIGDFT